MAKRISALFLCAVLMLVLSSPAYARFSEYGDYSTVGRYGFAFDTDDALLIWGDEVHSYPHDDIWVGTKMYVPIYCDFDGDFATKAQLDYMKAGITYKANRFVESVTIIDGAAENPAELEPGAYARITFTEEYLDVVRAGFTCSLVITVDGVAQQRTRVSFADSLKNRVESLTSGSVYTVYKPTVFSTERFTGEAVFDFGNKIRYTTHVAKDSRYYLSLDRTPIAAIAEQYKKVYTEVYDFRGDHDTFIRGGKLQIPINVDSFKAKKGAKTTVYVYTYDNGRLYSVDPATLSYSSNTGLLTIDTLTLETYVLSAQALLPELSEEDDDIIKTDFAKDETAEPPVEEPPTQLPDNADNPISGGGSILTSNAAAQNPSTSDNMSPMPALVGLAGALAGLLCARKYKHKG